MINLIFSSNDLMLNQNIFSLSTNISYERDYGKSIYEELGLSS